MLTLPKSAKVQEQYKMFGNRKPLITCAFQSNSCEPWFNMDILWQPFSFFHIKSLCLAPKSVSNTFHFPLHGRVSLSFAEWFYSLENQPHSRSNQIHAHPHKRGSSLQPPLAEPALQDRTTVIKRA